MDPNTQQLISLASGVALALTVWIVTRWSKIQLDWKEEIKALLAPVAIASAGMLAAGMDWKSVVTAALTMLGTALGLNRSVQAKPTETK